MEFIYLVFTRIQEDVPLVELFVYKRMYLWWSLYTLYLLACKRMYLWWSYSYTRGCTSGGVIRIQEDVPLVEFIYPVFTRIQEDVPLEEFIYLVFTRIEEDVPLVEFI